MKCFYKAIMFNAKEDIYYNIRTSSLNAKEAKKFVRGKTKDTMIALVRVL